LTPTRRPGPRITSPTYAVQPNSLSHSLLARPGIDRSRKRPAGFSHDALSIAPPNEGRGNAIFHDRPRTSQAPPPRHRPGQLDPHPADDRLQADPDAQPLGDERMSETQERRARPRGGGCGRVQGVMVKTQNTSVSRFKCSGRGSRVSGASFSAACYLGRVPSGLVRDRVVWTREIRRMLAPSVGAMG